MRFSAKKIKKFNKIKDIINLILAMYITLTPIITILLNVVSKKEVYIHKLFQSFGVMYLIFLPFIILCICMQKGFLQRIVEKLKKLPIILALALYGWIMLSCMVTNSFNVFLFYFIIYICIFISIIMLDDKYENLIINTLICSTAISCLFGIIDPTAKFMPGFDKETYPLSLQFYNPNYAGYLMALVSILNTWIMCNTHDKKQRIVSIIGYILLNFYLFMNGSFAPITFVFFSLILMIVFIWIKEKKCPTKILLSFICMIPMAFIVDAIPNINTYRTCQYNYFLECIAVVDNYLGTNMLRMFGISKIAGADGWGRESLQDAAWAEILGNFKTFLFGNGSGGNFEFIPHNTLLCLWLNYGIIATILYYLLNIYLIIRFFKLKKNLHLVGYMASVVGYILMMFTGDLIEYSFCFHMIILAFAYKKVEKAHEEQLKEEQEEHIRQYLAEQEALGLTPKKSTRKSQSKKPSNTAKKTSNNTKGSTTKKSTNPRSTKNISKTIKESDIALENEQMEEFLDKKVEVIVDTENI